MTQTPPDAALLAAAIDYLEAQLLPELQGEHRFKARLLVNALKAVARNPPTAASGNPQGNEDPASRLALAIRSKAVALDEPALLAQLESQLRLDLQINNPKWLDGPPVAAQNGTGANAANGLDKN
jgi:hypothetical protein